MTFWGYFAIKTRSKTELDHLNQNVLQIGKCLQFCSIKTGFVANNSSPIKTRISGKYFFVHTYYMAMYSNEASMATHFYFASLNLFFFSHTGRIEQLSSRHEKMWFVLTETTNIFSNFIVLPVESLTSENISIKQKKKRFQNPNFSLWMIPHAQMFASIYKLHIFTHNIWYIATTSFWYAPLDLV